MKKKFSSFFAARLRKVRRIKFRADEKIDEVEALELQLEIMSDG